MPRGRGFKSVSQQRDSGFFEASSVGPSGKKVVYGSPEYKAELAKARQIIDRRADKYKKRIK